MVRTRKYGPYGKEVLAILAEFRDHANADVVSAIRENSLVNNLGMFSELPLMMFGKNNTVQMVVVRARRKKSLTAVWKVAGNLAGAHVAYALAALSIRDLVGVEFTQWQYEMLTQAVSNFTAVAHSTKPGSLYREFACSLMARGMSGSDALVGARGALSV